MLFRTGSPYSPFFTSGLLSQHSLPDSDPPLGPRRGSLPTDSPTRSLASPTDTASAFYFTLQPKRDNSEYRSFLSLDLAESTSLRSASLKRKASNASTEPLAHNRTEKAFTVLPHIPEAPSKILAPPHSSLRLRVSRDSLRTIPSPKPAPSMTLPDVPRHLPPSPSPSPIPSTPPRLPSIAIDPSLDLSIDRASQSAPSLLMSHMLAPTAVYKAAHRDSMSSISTRVRTFNRSHALARLEGRSNSTRRVKTATKPFQRNFMSMSDDEDDTSDSDQGTGRLGALGTILEPEDVVFPLLPPMQLQGIKSAPLAGRFPSLATSRVSPRKSHTTKDWFPLKSFIDLQGEDEMSRWSWRSFIEVASVS